MIKVRIFQEERGKISGFSVTGHSGMAQQGEDIVCAGVSSLTDSAFLGIREYLHREVAFQAASGKLEMKLKDFPDDLTEAILQTMLLGLREISKAYPRQLQILDVRR